MPPKKNILSSTDDRIVCYYASQYDMNNNLVIKKIDEHVTAEAHRLKKSYQYIYQNHFTNVTHLNQLPHFKDLTMKNNNQVYYEPYGFISKVIQDADLINEDPDDYIMNFLKNTSDLKKLVDIASYLYHNYEGGGLTDNSFDALEYHLRKKLKLENKSYDEIGAMPVDKIKKQLAYGMPSLTKIKPGESKCHTFLSSCQTTDCLWMHKLDGISCMATYLDGQLVELNTRGNGTIGGDITHLATPLRIQQTINHQGLLVVRGELIMNKTNWEKYKGDYCNPRALVSGKVNAGTISPVLNDIDFIIYEMMNDNDHLLPLPIDQLKTLSTLGFQIVQHGMLKQPTLFQVMQLYMNERNECGCHIDGLVLKLNQQKQSSCLLNDNSVVKSPVDVVAFKMTLEKQIRTTKVTGVEWNITRYGRYFPTVCYKPIYIDGNRCHRASGHNANHIKKWSLGKNTQIDIVRSGMSSPSLKIQ